MKLPSKSFLLVVSLILIGATVAAGFAITPSLWSAGRWTWLLGASHRQSRQSGPMTGAGDDVERLTLSNDADVPLAADLLADKKPTFDPTLVDRRPFEAWQVNTSGAVVQVDTPRLFDGDGGNRPLAASYAAAMASGGLPMLASVNLIDGKAKQFDDGLYAAIDRAYYAGDPVLGPTVVGHRALLGRMLARVAPGSAAADYLSAGLSLDGGHPPPVPLSREARALADRFRANEIQAKPISFYTWDPTLGDCFRVLRYFSQPITDPTVVAALAQTLWDDGDLRARYQQATSFYARLTNPPESLSLLAFVADSPPVLTPSTVVSLFPPSTSREVELFRRLFPDGPPANAQMMRALVVAIRSGQVDLAPNPRSGWYEYQAYALEPLLLPERGAGADHLLLTRAYKKRMLVAFEALLTKRRETHARQLGVAGGAMEAPTPAPVVPPIKPRLRVEPNPSYYLRTARAYAFVADLLEATFGAPAMGVIHGLRATGPRPDPLGAEVRQMRDLFLGLAFLSAEDLGHRLTTTPGEAARRAVAEAAAAAWLGQVRANPNSDPDLAADTRVAVPIGVNPRTGKVRLWATIGVSLTPLHAEYVRPPQIRPAEGGDWRIVQPDELKSSYEYVAVDEFAEIELDNGRVLNRDELRAICDTHKTRDAIRRALGALR